MVTENTDRKMNMYEKPAVRKKNENIQKKTCLST